MAVPKRKTTKRTKGQRNSHAALTAGSLAGCKRCGTKRPPNRICPNCGHHGDREIFPKDE